MEVTPSCSGGLAALAASLASRLAVTVKNRSPFLHAIISPPPKQEMEATGDTSHTTTQSCSGCLAALAASLASRHAADDDAGSNLVLSPLSIYAALALLAASRSTSPAAPAGSSATPTAPARNTTATRPSSSPASTTTARLRSSSACSAERRRFWIGHTGRAGGWGLKDFVKKDDLVEGEHLVDDCLTVLCDVTVHDDPSLHAVEVAAPPETFDLPLP
ncbi:hypothetical protein ZWY2020_031903 [Hordeum vulgare]|nr:hypothetical protein ZWY2020_031903 [Hordeum vulgare]